MDAFNEMSIAAIEMLHEVCGMEFIVEDGQVTKVLMGGAYNEDAGSC